MNWAGLGARWATLFHELEQLAHRRGRLRRGDPERELPDVELDDGERDAALRREASRRLYEGRR